MGHHLHYILASRAVHEHVRSFGLRQVPGKHPLFYVDDDVAGWLATEKHMITFGVLKLKDDFGDFEIWVFGVFSLYPPTINTFFTTAFTSSHHHHHHYLCYHSEPRFLL